MSHYADVIRLLSNTDIDYRGLVYEIAALDPEIVIASYRAITVRDRAAYGGTGQGDWEKPCLELVRQGKFVDAIKLCREKTGKSLRDSKEAVENLPVNGG